ncbi:MAG TPA: response regulator [Gemmatimonadaceae bacterium]|nr:response regulator [Gemmatimonadaceae bacterium]
MILLVEDDEILAHLFERILRGAGFAVRTCRTGLEALLLLAAEQTDIDVVLSDIGLPQLSGDQLAIQLRGIRPGVPVLLMTGFSGRVTQENAHLFGVTTVLQKPISPRQLLSAIDDALSPAPSPRHVGRHAAASEVAER